VAHAFLASALQEQGKWGEAIAAYEQAVRLKPDYVLVHAHLASVLATCPEVKYRNAPRAVEAAQKAVELAPRSPLGWQVLGWAQYRAGAWQASAEALEKSCKLQDGVGDAFQWFFLAMAHWQLGHKDEARNWYDKAMQKEKVWPEELRRIRAEAAELLTIDAKPTTKPEPK
jgi:tetratricopeptide (TPR) repeat protein